MSALPHCTGLCHQGRTACVCPAGAAEAATDLGFEHEPAPSVISRRFRASAAVWLGALGIVGLYAVASEPPPEILAAQHLPGDGFPPELLALPFEPETAASEVQP